MRSGGGLIMFLALVNNLFIQQLFPLNMGPIDIKVKGCCRLDPASHTPPLPEVNFLMVEIPTPKPYIYMIRVTRQIKCLIAQDPGVIPHPLLEVNFLMVEIPTLKSYIYSLFSYLFIKQDQMIMICNSAVASPMLSRFLHISQ